PCTGSVSAGQVTSEEIEEAEIKVQRLPLLGWQPHLLQPVAAAVSEGVGRRTTSHQVAMEDGMRLVLQPPPLADDVSSAGDQAADHPCILRTAARHPAGRHPPPT